jgi:tricorn protease-like protein
MRQLSLCLLGALTLATAPAGIDAQAPNPAHSERPTMHKGYYRFPTIYGDTVAFTCEDDLWTVSVEGATRAA